jgi:hypothetical protein
LGFPHLADLMLSYYSDGTLDAAMTATAHLSIILDLATIYCLFCPFGEKTVRDYSWSQMNPFPAYLIPSQTVIFITRQTRDIASVNSIGFFLNRFQEIPISKGPTYEELEQRVRELEQVVSYYRERDKLFR